MLTKPPNIAADPFLSSKWDEITANRDFHESLAPSIAMLCNWYAVADKCMDDITSDGYVHVAYMNDMGDLKAFPQIATLKTASAEIRALNKQLGINDEATPAQTEKKETVIHVIQANRQSKANVRRGA